MGVLASHKVTVPRFVAGRLTDSVLPCVVDEAAAWRPDVVALTHDDRDHIGGAEGFFSVARVPTGY